MPLNFPKMPTLRTRANALNQAPKPPRRKGPLQPKKERFGDLKKRFPDVEFRGEFVLARGEGTTGSGYPAASFSHGPHRVRYQCSACHPTLFEMRAGSDTLTMDQLSQGEACGACHDGVNAFSQFECLRCHVAPEPADTVP